MTEGRTRTRPAASAVPRRLRLLQAADDAVGPWLCRLVPPGARRRAEAHGAPIASADVRRLLVIRPGGLGDAALSWPMLHALRDHFPAAHIDVLAERRNAGVYELADDAALGVLRYDDSPWAVYRRLRRQAYDLIVDTEQYHHLSVVLANALRPRWLCGFATLGRDRFQTHPVAHSEHVYEARAFLDLAAAVSGRRLSFDPGAAFIPVPVTARQRAMELMRQGSGPWAALLPAAGGPARRWEPERFAEVGAWLMERGHRLVLLAGADGIAAARQIADQLGNAVLDLAGRTSLAETAAILERAAVAISSDTGVLHLACGVGTSTVSLFGPGLHEKWGPVGPAHRIVRLGLPCSPCTRRGRVPPCPHDIACMRDMEPARVIHALGELLQ